MPTKEEIESQQKQKQAMEAKAFVENHFKCITEENLSKIRKYLEQTAQKKNTSVKELCSLVKDGKQRNALHFAASRGVLLNTNN